MAFENARQLVDFLRNEKILVGAALEEAERLAGQVPVVKLLVDQFVRRGKLTEFQGERLLQGDGASLLLKDYVLLEVLGEGAMGKVYKGRHRLLNRTVAIKTIRPENLNTPQSVRRFEREIQVAGQVQHPSIVHTADAGQAGATRFYVMEHVEGVDLGRLVEENGPLPVPLACDFARQTALALQYIHERGMVHRDIKPQNLMACSKKGAGPGPMKPGDFEGVKILDLGLAVIRPPEMDGKTLLRLTRMGAVMGTPDFMAPEQSIDAHLVDIRADLYSLGCTLYYLLTAQPLFYSGSVKQKLFQHRELAAPNVRVQRPEVPEALAQVLGRLLAKKAEERYGTPAEAARALEPFCGTSVRPEEKPPAPPVAPPSGIRPGKPPVRKSVNRPPATMLAEEGMPPGRGERSSKMGWIVGGVAGGVLAVVAVVLIIVFSQGGGESKREGATETDPLLAKKEDGAGKVFPSKDAGKKEELKKDEDKKEEIKKDDSKKEDPPKDLSGKEPVRKDGEEKEKDKKEVPSLPLKPGKPRPDAGWMKRHEGFVDIARKGNVDVLLLGDSITDGWRGGPGKSWDKYFRGRTPANFGIGGDGTENVLWRVQNGELDGIQPKVAMVLIGTNNLGSSSPSEVAAGITDIVQAIRNKTPTTKILLLGIFPRGEMADNPLRERIIQVNKIIANLDDGRHVFYRDIGEKFLGPGGSIAKEIMPDFLHLSERGYGIWAAAVEPTLLMLLSEPEGLVFREGLKGWKLQGDAAKGKWKVGSAGLNGIKPRLLTVGPDAPGSLPELINDNGPGGVDIFTEEKWGDATIMLEVMIPEASNSGIYVMGEYEVQVADSFFKKAVGPADMGGLYGATAPKENAAKKAGEWQTFVIEFQAPRFEGGKKISNAKFLKVILNGKVIHENVEMSGPTPQGLTGKEAPTGPLMFQGNHGPVAFRNIRVLPGAPGAVDAGPGPVVEEPEVGYVSLFNGKDLTGWAYGGIGFPGSGEIMEGKTQTPDGRIIVRDKSILINPMIDKGMGVATGLYTTKSFNSDFTLRLQFSPGSKAESGIYVRSPLKLDTDVFLRPMVRLWDSPVIGLGWNDLEIKVQDTYATCTINKQAPLLIKIQVAGPVGLLAKTGSFEYQNIRIRVIK